MIIFFFFVLFFFWIVGYLSIYLSFVDCDCDRLAITDHRPTISSPVLSSQINRPQFFFRTADVTGTCQLPKDVEMVVPGDNATMDIELIYPVAMSEGLRFALREGGKTVGAGVVAKLIE